jgi:hypothetical protein
MIGAVCAYLSNEYQVHVRYYAGHLIWLYPTVELDANTLLDRTPAMLAVARGRLDQCVLVVGFAPAPGTDALWHDGAIAGAVHVNGPTAIALVHTEYLAAEPKTAAPLIERMVDYIERRFDVPVILTSVEDSVIDRKWRSA